MARQDSGERGFTDYGELPVTDADRAASMAGIDQRLPGPEQDIDARGISPPLPLLRAYRALRQLPPGQPLKITTSYPQSIAEFQSMVKYVTGYELLSQEHLGDEYVHVLVRRR